MTIGWFHWVGDVYIIYTFLLIVRLRTDVTPGDIVQVNAEYNLCEGCYIVDSSSDASIVVNPDTLISGTSIASSITCTRK